MEAGRAMRKLVEIEVIDSGMAEKAIYKNGEKVGTESMAQVLYLGESRVKFLGEFRSSIVEKTCWSKISVKKGTQLFYARITNVDGNEYITIEGKYGEK